MRKKIKFCLAAFFILHLSFIASAQDGTQEDPFKGFPELVEDLISEWQIPGMAIGVVRDGEIIYMEGFGFRDLENKLLGSAAFGEVPVYIGGCSEVRKKLRIVAFLTPMVVKIYLSSSISDYILTKTI